MARINKSVLTRLEIVQEASKQFLEKGYTRTTVSAIGKELGMSSGNLTFYFPTKEHILNELVELLCDFQWQIMEDATDEGKSSMLAYCLELTTMAAVADENEPMRDFFLSAYSHPLTLDTIRRNDTEKIKRVFGEYCRDWTDRQFTEAEDIVSGIEYAALMATEHSADLPTRIAGSLHTVLSIFGVPEELQSTKVKKALGMDYRAVGRRLLEEFRAYTRQEHRRAIDEMLVAYNLKEPNYR